MSARNFVSNRNNEMRWMLDAAAGCNHPPEALIDDCLKTRENDPRKPHQNLFELGISFKINIQYVNMSHSSHFPALFLTNFQFYDNFFPTLNLFSFRFF